MTILGAEQRGLLALLKRRAAAEVETEWLARVAGSRELGMLREIALWWRCFQISAECRYTSRLLKRAGRFEETVADFFEKQATSPYIEHLGRDFLLSLEGDSNALIHATAKTERGMGGLRLAGADVVEVDWDRNPDRVFAALDSGSALPERDPGFEYRLRIGGAAAVECVRFAKFS